MKDSGKSILDLSSFLKLAWKGNRTVIISVGFAPFQFKMSICIQRQTSLHEKSFALCLANLTRWPDFVLKLYYSVLSQVLKTWNAAAVLDLAELFVSCKTGPKGTLNTLPLSSLVKTSEYKLSKSPNIIGCS